MPWIRHPATQDPVSLWRWFKFHVGTWMMDIGWRWQDEALYPDRPCDGCGKIRRVGDHRECDHISF